MLRAVQKFQKKAREALAHVPQGQVFPEHIEHVPISQAVAALDLDHLESNCFFLLPTHSMHAAGSNTQKNDGHETVV